MNKEKIIKVYKMKDMFDIIDGVPTVKYIPGATFLLMNKIKVK